MSQAQIRPAEPRQCASRVQRLRQVRAAIVDNIGTDVEMITQVIDHSIGGGKGLRALVAHISSDMCGLPRASCDTIAAAIEMIHFASLLHDDVVDEAALRRHRPTANVVFGPAEAVLAGDFLYSRASQMLSKVGNLELLKMISDATNQLAEGEVLQLTGKSGITTEESYYEVIERKTASLFAASSTAGPLVAGMDSWVEPLRSYGRELGCAFQMMDDCIDYEGESSESGKDAGHDLSIGTVTLPLLRARELADGRQREIIDGAISNGSQSADFAEIHGIIAETGAIKSVKREIASRLERAIGSLEALPSGPHREMLVHQARKTQGRRS